MNSFFDKLYIRQGRKVDIITININIKGGNDNKYTSIDEKEYDILCQNRAVFNIESKDDITMGLYYQKTNNYTFFLEGTLTNNYYYFKNGTIVELKETYKDIYFNLVVQDNLIDSYENNVNVSCILSKGSTYILKNMAIIKCIGAKETKSIMNDNVDIVLNWDIEENNNFKDIIINWPKSGEYLHKKNLYLYQLKVLSIRQTFLGFHNKSTEFYIFIYDLGYEPKLSFELPMSSPKNIIAGCQSLDSTTLKCIFNLKEQDLIEMAQLIPFKKGNQIKFTQMRKIKLFLL